MLNYSSTGSSNQQTLTESAADLCRLIILCGGRVVPHAWALTGRQVKMRTLLHNRREKYTRPVFLGDKTTAANVRCQQLAARGDYSEAKY